jgi:broad specificity phosphatase PhoE
MSEKTVYFVRHGQSEHNISDVFQHPDSPLTELGKQQAQKIASRVAHLSFESLISSPQLRAKQTALAIARATGKTPEYSDLFVERIKPKRLEGKSQNDPDAIELNRLWEPTFYAEMGRIEDGENFADHIKRADAALDLLRQRSEKKIVVVTHGMFLRTMFLRVILGDTLRPENLKNFQEHATMENTGLSALKYTNEWHFWIYNDHAHLG